MSIVYILKRLGVMIYLILFFCKDIAVDTIVFVDKMYLRCFMCVIVASCCICRCIVYRLDL
jgi:hypothetical protein